MSNSRLDNQTAGNQPPGSQPPGSRAARSGSPSPLSAAVVRHLTSQFHRPRGPLGLLAGRIMSRRGSNVDRNLWLVDLLAPEPTDRVLEIGPGPGVAMAAMAARVTNGSLVAVDHSTTMLRQTAARNREAMSAGRLQLIEGRAEQLPAELGPFDRIYAMNVWQFWDDQEALVASLVERLAPGGRLALGYQPRHRGATAADGDAGRRCLLDQFSAGGLHDITDHLLELEPAVHAVIGTKPR